MPTSLCPLGEAVFSRLRVPAKPQAAGPKQIVATPRDPRESTGIATNRKIHHFRLNKILYLRFFVRFIGPSAGGNVDDSFCISDASSHPNFRQTEDERSEPRKDYISMKLA